MSLVKESLQNVWKDLSISKCTCALGFYDLIDVFSFSANILRGCLPKGPRIAIFRLCAFFNELCQKVLDRNKLEQLEEDVVETLCMLEMYFPPSFFYIMVHLTIHLAREARLCGPVQYRWMYPFERYMKVLKGYVMNRAHPEGCIAERYLAAECSILCSKYIKQATEIGHKYGRNEEFDNGLLIEGNALSKAKKITLAPEMLRAAHHYVLINSDESRPYSNLHLEELQRLDKRLSKNETLLHSKHKKSFAEWFEKKVHFLWGDNATMILINEFDQTFRFA